MKKFTLILISMLFFLVGGVSSQTQTSLVLKGGSNWVGTSGGDLGNSRDCTSDVIEFRDKRAQYSYMTNNDWVDATEGTHTFVVTLGSSNNDDCTLHIAALNEVVSASSFDNGSIKNGIIIHEESLTVTNNATLTLSVSSGYAAIILWQTSSNDWRKVNIASFTRTVSAASSVAAPTITPASGTYDGDLTVTITKGAGNSKVVYSVSGATTGNVTNAEFTENSKTLNLTGIGTITVTATGYNGGDASSVVENTYTYSIPSGINTVWEGSQEVSNNWASGETFTIPTLKFSELEIGDYIFIYAAPASNVEYIGFRNGWSEEGFSTKYTAALGATSGGDLGKGTMQSTDTYWWAKIIDSDMLDIFKKGEPRVQGKSYEEGNENKFTITKVEIRKHVDIGEGANTISKSTDMIVNLGRSFTANYWNTVCLPFVPTSAQATQLFGEGYQLAAYTGVSGTTMQFTTIDIAAFEAGKPYLVLPKEGCATGTTVLFDVNITAKNPTPVTWGNYTFTGTFTTKTFSGDECNTSRFVATGNELKKPDNSSTLKSLRCYFTVPAAAARSLSFDVDEEGNTTGVADINRETITNNGDFFNLAGQRVAKPTKGLYIVNGKKVVIK